jgi:hypothetical protein
VPELQTFSERSLTLSALHEDIVGTHATAPNQSESTPLQLLVRRFVEGHKHHRAVIIIHLLLNTVLTG